MIYSIEQALYNLGIWYFELPIQWGLIILLGAGALFFYQYFKRDQTVVPGLLSLFLFFTEAVHLARPASGINFFQNLIFMTNREGPFLNEFPFFNFLLEPIFSKLVAPYYLRQIHHEVIFVALVLYIFFMIKYSVKEYKKTGVIFGDMSIKSAVVTRDVSRPQRSEFNELGSGNLASTEEIAQWTKREGDGDTILPATDLRGSDGISFKTANLVIPQEQRNRHILTVAKTGSGKTSRLILPILYSDVLSKSRSVIIIDSKPEMWEKLANLSKKYNPERNIVLFNPLEPHRSLGWNILSKIEDETDCKLIANTVIMATDNPNSKSDNPFFKNNALAVLNSMMVGLLIKQRKKEDILSMPRIHQLVQSGMKPLCAWLESIPEAVRTSKTFCDLAKSGSQNADTIMSELSMRLGAWDLPAIRTTTSKNEIDLNDLVHKPTLFIVEFKESDMEMLRPMANVIVVELLRFLTKTAENIPSKSLPNPVGFVIDEFASALGRLPDIHVKLNTLRSRNVSIVAAIQSTGQVKANYGDDADSVLAGFSTKIFMPALDNTDAEWASKETGNMTVRFNTISTGSNKKLVEWFASNNTGTQEQVQQRAVLTPDEIGRPADNRSTFFMPNSQPFQGHLVPFYKVPEVISRFNEFRGKEELKLREKPLEYVEPELPEVVTNAQQGGRPGGGPMGRPGGMPMQPPGITNTKGWSEEQVKKKLEDVKKILEWDKTTGSAKKWWEAFEKENQHRLALVLRLGEELKNRKATITEFFLAYVYSNTDNIQANLHYLDYTRLKKEEESKKREANKQASGVAPPASTQAKSQASA
jgi:type IV secretory pathway TraG/TraD family ATPase VirD4